MLSTVLLAPTTRAVISKTTNQPARGYGNGEVAHPLKREMHLPKECFDPRLPGVPR